MYLDESGRSVPIRREAPESLAVKACATILVFVVLALATILINQSRTAANREAALLAELRQERSVKARQAAASSEHDHEVLKRLETAREEKEKTVEQLRAEFEKMVKSHSLDSGPIDRIEALRRELEVARKDIDMFNNIIANFNPPNTPRPELRPAR
ncbi:MAG: hypothetical protein U0835_21860 [Isosphaeraceae bacterium]